MAGSGNTIGKLYGQPGRSGRSASEANPPVSPKTPQEEGFFDGLWRKIKEVPGNIRDAFTEHPAETALSLGGGTGGAIAGGTLGAALGAPLGPLGSLAGGALGAGLGYLGGSAGGAAEGAGIDAAIEGKPILPAVGQGAKNGLKSGAVGAGGTTGALLGAPGGVPGMMTGGAAGAGLASAGVKALEGGTLKQIGQSAIVDGAAGAAGGGLGAVAQKVYVRVKGNAETPGVNAEGTQPPQESMEMEGVASTSASGGNGTRVLARPEKAMRRPKVTHEKDTLPDSVGFYGADKQMKVVRAGDSYDTLYRGDTRAPEVVFKEGFAARGDNTNIGWHMFSVDKWKTDGYVSTTYDKEVARRFSVTAAEKGQKFSGATPDYTYIYKMNGMARGVDVNKTLGGYNLFPEEYEIAVYKGVKASDIYSAEVYKFDYIGVPGQVSPIQHAGTTHLIEGKYYRVEYRNTVYNKGYS